jgi:hypothetical protein
MKENPKGNFTLHKFRKINKHLIDSLVNRSLYFAEPDSLNDPFDCRIDLKSIIEKANVSFTGERDIFFKSVFHSEFYEQWNEVLGKVGVCAFSNGDPTNRLLWSHYGDEHKGVCLTYQFQGSEIGSESFNFTAGGPVTYSDQSWIGWLTEVSLQKDEFAKELLLTYLKTKHTDWKYEEEQRIIRNKSGNYFFNWDYPFIIDVCFGLRTPKADIDLVTKLASQYSGCSIFSKLVRNHTEFGLEKVLL